MSVRGICRAGELRGELRTGDIVACVLLVGQGSIDGGDSVLQVVEPGRGERGCPRFSVHPGLLAVSHVGPPGLVRGVRKQPLSGVEIYARKGDDHSPGSGASQPVGVTLVIRFSESSASG